MLNVGQTLTASAGDIADFDGFDPATIIYSWQRSADGSSGWSEIATGASYTLADIDAGQYIQVLAEYTDDGGTTEYVTSVVMGPVSRERLFVDIAASGNNDGTGWVDAFTNIQDAVDAAVNRGASASKTMELWVAEGVYKPASANAIVLDLQTGVYLYGGFDGTETSLEDRAGLFASTILSGDYLGDDDPDDLTINKTDNASTVVQALGAI
ncbi:MAG: hypothetical protein GY821_16210, partial [Gammaproteobacteria bacterium]|nr:hypothetical protein [Gammaproteobacteria bacterium]